MLRMVNDGDWHPVIDSVRPLAEAEAAHDRMKAGEHFGKLVLGDRVTRGVRALDELVERLAVRPARSTPPACAASGSRSRAG